MVYKKNYNIRAKEDWPGRIRTQNYEFTQVTKSRKTDYPLLDITGLFGKVGNSKGIEELWNWELVSLLLYSNCVR